MVLACGLVVTVFSNLPMLRLFGWLSALAMLLALIADLTPAAHDHVSAHPGRSCPTTKPCADRTPAVTLLVLIVKLGSSMFKCRSRRLAACFITFSRYSETKYRTEAPLRKRGFERAQ